MFQVTEKPLTLEEFLELPETKPASEFINNKIIQKPMPKGKHSSLQSRLVAWINQVALERELAHGFTELRCTFGGRSIIPDVSVFSWKRIPLDADGEIANDFITYPDWTIEILSPGQSNSKIISNILHCLDYGTQLGWLLDPSEKLAIAFLPKHRPIEISGDQKLPVPDFLELDLTASQMFGWLKKNVSRD